MYTHTDTHVHITKNKTVKNKYKQLEILKCSFKTLDALILWVVLIMALNCIQAGEVDSDRSKERKH